MKSITDVGEPQREELKTANDEPNLANSHDDRNNLKRIKTSTDVGEPKRGELKTANDEPNR